jgi:hypothetical protein
MSIHYADYFLIDFPKNIEEIKARFQENRGEENAHELFTVVELWHLWRLCGVAEDQFRCLTDAQNQGFAVVSDDRKDIDKMIKAKISVVNREEALKQLARGAWEGISREHREFVLNELAEALGIND